MKRLLLAALGFLVSQPVFAQPATDDIINRVMVGLFRKYNLQYLCLSEIAPLQTVRASIEDKLKGIDPNFATQENIDAISTVIYTAFPCPFSPDKAELRPAAREDMVGNWVVPEASERLRYGPRSPQWKSQPGMPTLKCEGVSYDADGRLLVMEIRGELPCPTSKDLDEMRKMPKVETWQMLRNGRLQSDHTGRPGSPEEWDVFVVEKPFEFGKVDFAAGDLVAYLRRSRGNNLNVSTVFRHLQRLP